MIGIKCPKCNQTDVQENGLGREGNQRYLCSNELCHIQSFILEYHYNACDFKVKDKIVFMAVNSSGIRDTNRVLGVSKTTVINTLKSKETLLHQVNPKIQTIGLATEKASVKWTMPIRDWKAAMNRFEIMFPDRIRA